MIEISKAPVDLSEVEICAKTKKPNIEYISLFSWSDLRNSGHGTPTAEKIASPNISKAKKA